MRDLNDDDVLELEEVEGLMDNTPVTKIGSRTHNVKQKRTEKFFCTLQSSRRLIGVLSILAMLMIVFLKDMWTSENDGINVHLSHTDKKEHHDIDMSLPIETDPKDKNYNFTIEKSNDEDSEKQRDGEIESTENIQVEDDENTQQNETKDEDIRSDDEEKQEIGDDEKKSDNIIEEKVEDEPQIGDSKNETSSQSSQEEIEKWGKWGFWDGEEEIRPSEDYCGKYDNRDIPGDKFPENSWQTDAV